MVALQTRWFAYRDIDGFTFQEHHRPRGGEPFACPRCEGLAWEYPLWSGALQNDSFKLQCSACYSWLIVTASEQQQETTSKPGKVCLVSGLLIGAVIVTILVLWMGPVGGY